MGFKLMNKKHLLAVISISSAMAVLSPNTHAKDGTFVHLFEWQWNDIATECTEFLGPKGFSAVQVSPPQEHIQGSNWWTRYQPVKHELATSRSGTATEFTNMVNTCKAAGVDIYVDAIINHTAGGSGTGTSGSGYNAHSLSFPQYSSNDFHSPMCEIVQSDYGSDAWRVRNCNLPGLPDLDTSSAYTRSVLSGYLNELTTLGVAGFRLDAAKHMEPGDIQAILSNVTNSPYVFQEVIDNGGEVISAGDYTHLGQVTEFKYSGSISDRFLNGNIADLFNLPNWGFIHSNDAVVFTDNHDNQRGHGGGGDTVTYKNGATYDLANVFMLAYPYGYPKVMSSFGFTDSEAGPPSNSVHNGSQLNCFGSEWQCEHRNTPIANMVGFRNFTSANTSVTDVWQDGQNKIAFGRGNLGFVVINRSNDTVNETFFTSLPAGEYCNVVASDDCSQTLTVDNSGRVDISVNPWSSAALHGGQLANGNSKPTAIIQALPTRVDIGSTISLIGNASTDSDGTIVSYSWTNNATQADTTAILSTEGQHCFTLTVTDNLGATGEATECTYAGDLPPQSNFDDLFMRGTANSWAATAMTLVSDYTWQLTVEFSGNGDGSGEQRFKFDRFGDWTENYGDSNNDGTAEQSGADVLFNQIGTYVVTFNDNTLAYSLEEVTGNKPPVAAITPSSLTVNIGELVTLSGEQSTDTDGSIAAYNWSTGDTTSTISTSYALAGTYTITLSVTDNENALSKLPASVTITVLGDEEFVSEFPTMNVRGTFNGWASTAMTLIANNVWAVDLSFTGTSNPDRFKFDAAGDWAQNWGDNNSDGVLDASGDDILINTAGDYHIEFHENGRTYTVENLNPGFQSNFATLYIRGTFNNWTCTAMTLTADNVWTSSVMLDNQTNQRFKFDRNCDWAINYGDTGANGTLDQTGTDIFVSGSGERTLSVNDATLNYSIN
jgi:alpha-amylase